MNFLRNKLYYTSLVLLLRVQWDFGDNCRHRKYRLPVRRVIPTREEAPPSFRSCCGWRNSKHQYIQGDYGCVCSVCGLFVPHGVQAPEKGPLGVSQAEINKKQSDPKASSLFKFMLAFAQTSGNTPITLRQVRKILGDEDFAIQGKWNSLIIKKIIDHSEVMTIKITPAARLILKLCLTNKQSRLKQNLAPNT